jgi:hypothetical protein
VEIIRNESSNGVEAGLLFITTYILDYPNPQPLSANAWKHGISA